MAAVHNKSRSELGLGHVLASLLAQFNGKSYAEFFKEVDRGSKEQGREWWGHVEKRGQNLTKADGEGPPEPPRASVGTQQSGADVGGTCASGEDVYALVSSGLH